MSFQVHVSDNMDDLLPDLLKILERAPADPLQPEIISVQGLGMRAWLAHALAEHFGIWAHFQFPFPRDLMRALHRQVLPDDLPDPNPFGREGLAWAIVQVLPGLLGEAEFAPLAGYLAADKRGDPDKLRLYRLADGIADCFDQYTLYRPDLIRAWEEEEAGRWQVGLADRWQPLLWRAAATRIRQAAPAAHDGELGRRFISVLQGKAPDLARAPERVCLFGITSLPPAYLAQLGAFARHRPVHLFHVSPSEQIHDLLADRAPAISQKLSAAPDRESLQGLLEPELHNPALRAFVWQPLEFQALLSACGAAPPQKSFGDPKARPTGSFLAALQAGLRDPAAAPACPERMPDDPSFSVHACHSPMREVQVVRDQILRQFALRPDLTPADVIVMCPDMEKYAPLVEAVFGSEPWAPGHIPYAISDRAFVRESPVAEAFLALLDLPVSRCTLPEIIDLFSRDAIRAKAGLTEAEMDKLQAWLAEAGVRWGIDADHRASFRQPAVDEHTWRFGLERLLLGYARSDPDGPLFADRAPLDRVEGLAAESLGRFAEYLQTLFASFPGLGGSAGLPQWRDRLEALLAASVAADGDRAYGHQEIRDALHEMVAHGAAAGFEGQVGLGVVKELLTGAFTRRVSGQGFESGKVTFCKLLPMRSLRYRVVCLLGMNDQDFPRTQAARGFDLIARHPRPGDRSTQLDDRHQFLEAVLAAQDALIITFEGRDIQDNKAKPPAVVLSELLDAACGAGEGTPAAPTSEARARLITRHPLHAFDQGYFQPEGGALVSYDHTSLAGAQVLIGDRPPPPPFWSGPLSLQASGGGEELSLDDLIAFFLAPARVLLQQVLGISFPPERAFLPEREPLLLDPLEKYGLGSFQLQHPDPEALGRARAQGFLPPGVLGNLTYRQLWDTTAALREEAGQVFATAPEERLAIDIPLPGFHLGGALDGVRAGSLTRLDYGKLDGKRLLRFWLGHLALSAQGRAQGESILITRGDKDRPQTTRLPALAPDRARVQVEALLALYQRGQSEPLRFFPKSSWAFASAQDPDQAFFEARKLYEGSAVQGIGGESGDAYVQRVFGQTDALRDLPASDPLSFPALAEAVFGDLAAILGEETP